MSELDDHGSTPTSTQPPRPWGTPANWPLPLPTSGASRPRLLTARDAVVALAVALVVAALGVPLGLVWSALGPHPQIVMTAAGPDLADYNTEAFVAGDLSFGAIALVTGIVLGAAAWALRRYRGPLIVVALAVGGLAGAWIAWKVGAQLGLAQYRHLLRDAPVGKHFGQPMKLRSHGLLFLLPIVAIIAYVVNAAWSRYPDLRPSKPDHAAPAGPLFGGAGENATGRGDGAPDNGPEAGPEPGTTPARDGGSAPAAE